MSLIARYKLDGNALDSSGNGYHGTPTGMTYTNDKFGLCGDFNGSTSAISLSSQYFQNRYFTISCWIKSRGLATGMGSGGIFSISYSCTLRTAGIGYLYTRMGNSLNQATHEDIYTTINLHDNQWHHIVYSYDNLYKRAYIDGVKILEKEVHFWQSYTNPSSIGTDINDGATTKFWGKMYDVRYYNHKLTDEEVYDLYDLSNKEVSEMSKSEILDYTFDDYQEPTTNIMPYPDRNGRFTTDNTWLSYQVSQWNNGVYFSIGIIDNITDNIVTLSSISTAIGTYDVLKPQTSGGGVTAGTNYFIKKISTNQFTLHAYNGNQNGSQGYINPITGTFKVHDSIALDQRVSINSTNFPTMWIGEAHLPNSTQVKEIVPNGGYVENTNCMRVHMTRTTNMANSGIGYGTDVAVIIGDKITISFWAKASSSLGVGVTVLYTTYFGAAPAFQKSFTLTENWQRVVFTGTAPATYNFIQYFFPPVHTTVYAFDIADMQIEKKPYVTEFTTGTRPGIISDFSGIKNNTTLAVASTPTWSSNGRNGTGCYSFDGVSQYIYTPLTNGHISASADYTQSLWFNSTRIDNAQQVLIDDNNQWEHYIMITSAKKIYASYWNVIPYSVTSIRTVDFNTWNHVCCVVKSGISISIYVNGELWGENTSIGGVHSKIYDDSVIGATGVGHNSPFQGLIDDVKIISKALTPSEVWSLYNDRTCITNIDDYGNLTISKIIEDDIVSISEDSEFTLSEISEVGITDGLIAWYPLNGNVNDYSGNGNNGTLSGATIVNGISQSAYSFDGTNDYINTNILPSTNNLCITMWVKHNSISDKMFLSSGQIPNTDARLYLGCSTGKWDMGIYNQSWGGVNGGTIPVTLNWTFICLNMNGATATMYVDGVINNQRTYSNYILNQNIYIATHGTNGTYYFNGLIQDVRIYNRALSAEEVMINYDSTYRNTTTTYNNTSADTNGLLAWYKLDGDVLDYSGNNRHGTVYGTSITSGLQQQCYDFTTISDYIDITSCLVTPKTTYSISFWAKIDTIKMYLFFKGQSTNEYIMATANTTAFYHNLVGSSVKVYIDTKIETMPIGDKVYWHHYVATGIDFTTWTQLYISSYPSYYLDAKIQDVRIYNKVLTQDEINLLYYTSDTHSSPMKIKKDGKVYISNKIKEV